MGAKTCALPLFCDRDLEINPLTFKFKGDLDIPKMYFRTENEAASLRNSKHRAWIKKNTKTCFTVKGQGQNVKSSELLQASL